MNRKRIFIIIFILLGIGLLGYSAKTLVLDKNQDIFSKKSVKGTSTQKNSNVPSASSLETELKKKLDTIKQEVSKLDIADIASSSPQVQKLINDLNALKDYPSNQIKDVCEKICSGL
jgi:hypothetical protein